MKIKLNINRKTWSLKKNQRLVEGEMYVSFGVSSVCVR